MKTSKVNWKVERLAKMHKTKKVNFDLVIQRKDNIWDNKRQSTLIHSILSGYPIPSLFATKDESVYHFLDGKQRLSSIFDYIEDGYALHPSIAQVNGETIAGLKFSELPESMQESIKQYEIDFVRIEEINQQEMEELFYRLNNGVPLRQIETTRAILGSKVLKFVESIAELDFFATKANLSKGARKRFVDQELVLQILALVHNNETGFSGKELQAFVQELRNIEIQDSLRAKMQNACYYLNEAFPKKEKFLKKLHVPMLFKLVLDMIEKGELANVTPKEFGSWATGFFADVPEDYAGACQSGSARKENVQKRLSVLSVNFYLFVENKLADEQQEEAISHLKQLADQEELEENKAV
jgi:Protein of unknown function DUF262